jgi:hypothetical protein
VSSGSTVRAQLWGEQWAIQASVKAASIEGRLRSAIAGVALDQDPRAEAAWKTVRNLLDDVEDATTRRKRRLPWRRFSGWWYGTSVERTYQSLHAAEIFLIDLIPDYEVDAAVPQVVARALTVLERDDPRRAQVEQLASMQQQSDKRAAMKAAMSLTYDATDQLHVRVRDFRNILLATAAFIAVFMGAFVWLVSLHSLAVPFCFRPTITAPADLQSAESPSRSAKSRSAPTTQGTETLKVVTVCPTGDDHVPSGGDVVLVAGLGVLGGALAGAFAIRNTRGTSTPYKIPIALALLKVPSGALTSVAGILLLGGGFVPGLSELDSQRQILAYAIVFGYAQQIATRLIDNQAQTILDSLPSKDPDAKGPDPAWEKSPSKPPPGSLTRSKTVNAPADQLPNEPAARSRSPVKKLHRAVRRFTRMRRAPKDVGGS